MQPTNIDALLTSLESSSFEDQVKAQMPSLALPTGNTRAITSISKLVERYNHAMENAGIDKWFVPGTAYSIENCPKHKAFFDASKKYTETLFIAGNRVGKTLAGAFALACHLTGDYPFWWNGRTFDHPTHCWAAGSDAKSTRDTVQKELLGPIGSWGTGLIPLERMGKSWALSGVPQGVDTIEIKHRSGGMSTLGFKNYQQSLSAFYGTARHAIWLDEICPADIYNECLIRTMTTNGIVFLTFTPLEGLTPLVVNFFSKAVLLEGSKPLLGVSIEDSDDEGVDARLSNRVMAKAIITAGWDDAPWLTEESKARMLDDTPPHLRNARSKGEPSMGSGNIYPIPLDEILVAPFEIPAYYERICGLDVGWNNCLAKDSMVMLPDGTKKPIQDIQVGEEVLAFDFKTENLIPTKVVDTFKGYATNMVTVGISKEQQITCTDDHPFAHRAVNTDPIKFKDIKDINARIREFQSVVLPSRWDIQDELDLCSTDMARILGYMLGDGCITYRPNNRHLSFAQKEQAYIDDMRKCLASVGCGMKSYNNNMQHRLSGNNGGPNEVLKFLRHHKLIGTDSTNKFIPPAFFKATRPIIENLLVGLIHTDGSVEGDNVRYYTISKQLAEDVKTLCLRLGIYASISCDYRKRKENHNVTYRVTMRRPTSLPLLYPKELVPTRPDRKKRTDRLLSKYEAAPPQDIYCITVEHEDHAFVCNDFVVSNTAALWLARNPDTGVTFIYDEYLKGGEEPVVHAHALKQRGSWIPTMIDPAARGRSQIDGRKVIDLYRNEGLALRPAENEVEAGILNFWSALSTGKIKVFNTLPKFQREYALYRRDLNGKVIKENDHLMDAGRYAFNGILRAISKQANDALRMGPIMSTSVRYDI